MDEMTKPRFSKCETGFFIFALTATKATSRLIKRSRALFWRDGFFC